MFYSFGFFDLEYLPLKHLLHMDTDKFEDENQVMYCLLDIRVIIKSLKLRDQKSNFLKFWSKRIH
jgi:hypothetical protein